MTLEHSERFFQGRLIVIPLLQPFRGHPFQSCGRNDFDDDWGSIDQLRRLQTNHPGWGGAPGMR